MDISAIIKQVARGRHGAENLSCEVAEATFFELLDVGIDPLQLGAFLIAQRMKGETADELAGFVRAARRRVAGYGAYGLPACVDLPCYAGKRRAPHAYLAAALKARDAGIPVFIHGVAGIEGRVTIGELLPEAGVQRADNLSAAAGILQDTGMVYVDLSDLCPDLFRVYQLRERLGVRSFSNTVARLLNPMGCNGQLNGFFHTPYADYMAGANVLLGQPRSLLFMGAEGEPELYADRQKLIIRQTGSELTPVRYDEAGEGAYPRQAMDLATLKRQSLAMTHGDTDARERAVIARMLEAFNWAADGRWPQQWKEEY